MLKSCKPSSLFIVLATYFFLVQGLPHLKAQVVLNPLFVTEPVKYDSDDPAIWIDRQNPALSLIIGTDKGQDGALYVFNMAGKIIQEKVVRNLRQPNNVDVAYGLILGGKKVDIAVTTERLSSKLRIFSVPEMQPVDNGGINVFEGERDSEDREPMGIALYTNPLDNKIYAIVSRKSGPVNGTYLWQYRLEDDGRGNVKGTLVRKFGKFSGRGEIESVVVDNELGYIYYSDEKIGVRKYYANPEKGNSELAVFATSGFENEREGISIYKMADGTGYILVSDQQAGKFHIFTREGTSGNKHDHKLLKVVAVKAKVSDGSEIVNFPILPSFPNGVFVAMSDDRTFHLYRWDDIAGKDLKIVPPVLNIPPPSEPSLPPSGALVGHWRLDEGSGTALLDASTYQNKATTIGSPTWVTGIAGQALKLDGTSQYATVPDNASLDITSAITLAAWIKPERTATQFIIKKSLSGQSNGYELSLSSLGPVYFRINQASSGDTYRLNSATTYPNDGNTWMHVAATFNGTVLKIYINGVENSSKTLSAPRAINTNANALGIGAQSDGLNKFKGTLDEARVYNRALSATEISQLASGSPTLAKSPATGLETMQQAKPNEELLAYPNPITSKTNLSFSLAADGEYTLNLYDAKGAHIQLLQQGKATKGNRQHVELDASRLHRGLYMARLQTSSGTKTLRLMLQ